MMRILLTLSLVSIVFCQAANITDYYHLPTYIIDLDQSPEMRFAQVTMDLKDQINIMIEDYLHLAPKFVQNFFESNINVIRVRNLEHYKEVVGISQILGQESWKVYMLNNAFEIEKALCTSIVAR